MIDIHSHIIPYVDDGAEDWADAILMAELAVESGVHTIITTPHSNIPGGIENRANEDLLRYYTELKKRIKDSGIPLRLLSGMEIFATEDVVEKIARQQFLPLNGSKHYLIEFDFYQRSIYITHLLEQLCSLGVVPIVAHPERYVCVQRHPQVVMDWIDMGCQLQMNKGSIFGSFGRAPFQVAEELLFQNLITYIASDAHSPYHRTTHMRDIYEMLSEEISVSFAEKILVENPQRYLIEKR